MVVWGVGARVGAFENRSLQLRHDAQSLMSVPLDAQVMCVQCRGGRAGHRLMLAAGESSLPPP